MKQKDIYRVRLPVPFFVNHVYVHLIENLDDSSLLLIDCGPATEDAFAILVNYVQSIGYAMEDIGTCIVTHSHYEHYGLLRRIKKECNAQILAHQDMITSTSDLKEDLSLRSELLIVNGTPTKIVDKFLESYEGIIKSTPKAELDKIVSHEEYLYTKIKVIWTPGHSKDHICIYNEETKTIFTGDHIISKVTPQIGHRCIEQLEDPLKTYQESLNEVLNYDIELAFPAHNEMIKNPRKRVLEILKHHESRERWILEVLNNKKLTAFELANRVFGENLSLIGHIISCTETIAHLKSLKVNGKVNEIFKEGLYYYEKIS